MLKHYGTKSQEQLLFENVISSRLQYHTQVPLALSMFAPSRLSVRFNLELEYFADCLNILDETTTPGSAAASNVYCNRALVLLRQQPPDNQGALQDSSCAIACNQANCKVSNGHVQKRYT